MYYIIIIIIIIITIIIIIGYDNLYCAVKYAKITKTRPKGKGA